MLRYVLLATVAFAAPALAQETPPSGTVPSQEVQPAEPTQVPPAPTEATPAPQEGQTAPAADNAQAAQPAPAEQPAATAAAEPAPAQQPATNPTDIATVVNAEFPKFDADKNGGLDKAEFSTWMTALRKASEPTFQPESAEAIAWNEKAFSQADVDKSASVNATELTVFLTPKAS